MPYIPQNRIQMNLYTGGAEYAILINGREYTGYYYKLYTGKVYTGKTPNDPFTQELTPIFKSNQNTTDPASNTTVYIALFNGDPDPPLVGDPATFPWVSKNIINYLRLRGENPNTVQAKNMVQSYIPQPTLKDYKHQQIYRYFVKKRNENIYKEISQNTFNKILKSDKTLYSRYYKPFRLIWQITGNQTDAGMANKRVTLYLEKALNLQGFQQFLNNDFLKFYKFPNLSNLYTSGNEFKTADGKNYIG